MYRSYEGKRIANSNIYSGNNVVTYIGKEAKENTHGYTSNKNKTYTESTEKI